MIITQTPLRISFAGGGTDFREYWREHGGAVVGSTIDKYIHVIVKERFDDLIVLNYSRREIVSSVDDIQHGLIRESMKLAGVEKGVEITTLADIPSEGSGLGSSSSVAVGLLHALYTYQGELVTAKRLASEACRIEIDILRSPIGIQDQYFAAFGGLRFFEFCADGEILEQSIELSSGDIVRLNSRLLLFYLNKTRKSASILEEQKLNISRCLDSLRALRDLAFRLREELRAGNFDLLGELLHQGWLEKRSLAGQISNDEIDGLYKKALDAGALGGKVPGAGGGGFLLLYVPPDRQEKVRKSLAGLKELPFTLEPDGSKVIFNQRRSWKK